MTSHFQVLMMTGMARWPMHMMVFLVLFCFCEAASRAEYMKYKDPEQQLNASIRDLMTRMTLEEKIVLVTQIDLKIASPEIIKKYFIGTYFCQVSYDFFNHVQYSCLQSHE